MRDELNFHAIYLVLNEGDFFEASLRSIYPHITGATVVTNYDVDWWGKPVDPDGTIERLLSRELDPDHKVDVIVTSERTEHLMRNRAMAFAAPRSRDETTVDVPDYFWIVDADEIYDEPSILRLKEWVRTHPAAGYRIGWEIYFRTWNWRIEDHSRILAVVKPGFEFGLLRHERKNLRHRAILKLADKHLLREDVAFRLNGIRTVPREVAMCHHGSWVGDRERMAAKLANSGHRNHFVPGWLENVWDQWTPESRRLHPLWPEQWDQAHHVPTDQLPAEIRAQNWPPGWIQR